MSEKYNLSQLSKISLNIFSFANILFLENTNAKNLFNIEKSENKKEDILFCFCIDGLINLQTEKNIELKTNDYTFIKTKNNCKLLFNYPKSKILIIRIDEKRIKDISFINEELKLNLYFINNLILNKPEGYIYKENKQVNKIILKLWNSRYEPSIFNIQILFIQLIYLFTNYEPEKTEETNNTLKESQIIIATKIKTLIKKDLSNHISLEEIASQLNTSVSSIKKYFRTAFGMNISDFVVQERILKAKELLCNTKVSITDISYEVGYKKSGNFSQIFKNETGMTPFEYRRTYLNL